MRVAGASYLIPHTQDDGGLFIPSNMKTVFQQIEASIDRSELRYGQLASTHEALGVAIEEWDELRDAVRANDLQQVKAECIDLAAVLVRLAMSCNGDGDFYKRSVK